MKKSQALRTLKGFQDVWGTKCQAQKKFISLARQAALTRGFEEIDTPAIELAEILKSEGDIAKEIYQFEDHGGRKVGLRFDLTVPFARFYTEHLGTLPTPFKRFQIGKVWRGEKPQAGRYREFYQIDFDIIGTDRISSEWIVLETMMKVLDQIVPRTVPLELQINHRNLLSSLLTHYCGARVEAKMHDVMRLLDKKEKLPAQKFKEMLLPYFQEEKQMEAFLTLLNTEIKPSSLEQLISTVPELDPGVAQSLLEIFGKLESMGLNGRLKCRLNLGLARGLDYYTGLVFETILAEQPGLGSIASGGRYHHLCSRFLQQDKFNTSGFGGSIGLDRILNFLSSTDQIKKPVGFSPAVYCEDKSYEEQAFAVYMKLIQDGIACEFCQKEKWDQALKWAKEKHKTHLIKVNETWSIYDIKTNQKEKLDQSNWMDWFREQSQTQQS